MKDFHWGLMFGRELEGQTKGFSGCCRCGQTWDKCEGHTIRAEEDRGAFPCCESCWKVISIEEKKYWLNKLVDEWNERFVKSISELRRNNVFRTAALKAIEEEQYEK